VGGCGEQAQVVRVGEHGAFRAHTHGLVVLYCHGAESQKPPLLPFDVVAGIVDPSDLYGARVAPNVAIVVFEGLANVLSELAVATFAKYSFEQRYGSLPQSLGNRSYVSSQVIAKAIQARVRASAVAVDGDG